MTTVAAAPMDSWETLPWQQLQRNVFKLQKRIYVRHESRVPVDDTSRLRNIPPGTPFSLSPRNRVSVPRLRRQYVRTSAECKAHERPNTESRTRGRGKGKTVKG
jgi:hypothetical protein